MSIRFLVAFLVAWSVGVLRAIAVAWKRLAASRSAGFSSKRRTLQIESLEERQLLATNILDLNLMNPTGPSLGVDFTIQVANGQYAALDLSAAGLYGYDCGNVVLTNKATGATTTLANNNTVTTNGVVYVQSGTYTLTVASANGGNNAAANIKIIRNDSAVNTGGANGAGTALVRLQDAATLQKQVLAGTAPVSAWANYYSQNKATIEAVYGVGALDCDVNTRWAPVLDVNSDGKFDNTDRAIAQQAVTINTAAPVAVAPIAASSVVATDSNTQVVNPNAATVTLSSTQNGQSITEGGSIIYTVTVSKAVAGSPFAVTLSNGTVITIQIGATTASSTVSVRADDVYKQGDQALSVTISSTTGGNYEAVTTTGTVTNTVKDDADVTTVTLNSVTAGQNITEGSSIVYTATVSNAVTGSPFVVTLSNGTTITIPVGATTASSTIAVRADDVYKQTNQALSVTINNTSGGNYEAITTTGTVNNTVIDDADATTVTLSSATNGQSITEGGSIIYTVTVSNAVTGTPFVVTLSNGATITIPIGQLTASSTVAVRADDVYKQANQALSVTISNTSGGNYEAVTTTGTVANTVIDDADATTVTLNSTTNGQNITEGSSIIYTVTVNNAVTGSPFVVTLSNGATITIPVGQTTASSTVAVRADDVYAQGNQSLSVTISSTSGGNYEAVTAAGTVNHTVVDNANATTVTLSSATNGQSITEGSSIIYTVTVSNAVTGSPFAVTLSNGTTITIPVGTTTASSTVAVRADDVYKQGNVALAVVTISNTSGGNYEAVTTSGIVNNTVVDDADATTVTLGSGTAGQNITEGNSIVYTATVNNAVTGSDLVVTLSNGIKITIPVGATSASSTVAVRADDMYAQGDANLSVTISSTSGGNYEAVTTIGTVTNTVVDNTDATTVTLSSATDGQNITEGGSITYTVTASNAVTGTPFVVTLSNGATITIPVGQITASSTVAVRADDMHAQGNENLSVTISSTSGGNYEDVTTTGTVANTVVDDADATTASISLVQSGVNVSVTITLDNAVDVGATATVKFTVDGMEKTHTFTAGETKYTLTLTDHLTANPYGDATTVNAVITEFTGGNFEACAIGEEDGVSEAFALPATETTLTLSTVDVDESDDGTVTFKVQMSSAPKNGVGTVMLEIDGEEYTVDLNADGTGTLTIAHSNDEDVYNDPSSVTATVTATTGYGNAAIGQTATAEVGDTIQTTTATIDRVEADGANVVVTAKLDAAPKEEVVVKVTIGGAEQNVTIKAGEFTGSTTFENILNPNSAADAKQTVEVSLTVADPNAGKFENLVAGASKSVELIPPPVVIEDVAVTSSDVNMNVPVEVTGFTLPDGFTIDADNLPTPTYGTFTTDGTKLYFTQTSPFTHGVLGSATDTSATQAPVTIIVKDASGNTGSFSVTVTIIDAEPTAVDDSTNVTEGAMLTVNATNGVLANDSEGADKWAVGGGVVGVVAGNSTNTNPTGGVGEAIAGTYGTLTLNSDGSYTYKANADAVTENASDVFTYTVKDGDGDMVSTTLTINVNDVTLGDHPISGATVNEADLTVGAAVSDWTAITGLPEGATIETSTSTTSYGSFTVQAKDGGGYEYQYTLNAATNNISIDTVILTVTDTNGNTGTVTLTVDITDDIPTLADASNEVDEGDTDPITGNVLTDLSYGADGAGSFQWNAESGATTYGTITLSDDGTYSYTLDNENAIVKALTEGAILTETFTYTITDADGDTVTKTLTITINGVDNDVTVTPDNDVLTVYEGGLTGGNQSGAVISANGSMDIDAKDGVAAIEIEGKIVYQNGELTGNTVTTDEGTLSNIAFDSTTGKLTYTYTLTQATQEHTGESDASVSHDLTVTVTDRDGSEGTSTITITIVDDIPTISVTDATGAYNSEITGSVDMKFGADGEACVAVTLDGETVTGEKGEDGNYTFALTGGTLRLNTNGTFSYNGVPKSGKGATYEFTFEVMDSDGDIASASTTASIAATDVSGTLGTVISHDVDVADTTAHDVTITGLPTGAALVAGTYTNTGGGYGTITVDDAGNATFTQTTLYTHNVAGADTQTGVESIGVTVILGDGSTATMNVTVDIVDDAPIATDDTASMVEGQTLTVLAADGVLKNDTAGADGWAATGAVTGVAATDWTLTTPDTGYDYALTSSFGTLNMKADGSYQFVSFPNSVTSDTDLLFTYTVKDADGDTKDATLTITVKNILLPVIEIIGSPASLTELATKAEITFTTSDPNNLGGTLTTTIDNITATGLNGASQTEFAKKLTQEAIELLFKLEGGTLTFTPGDSFLFLGKDDVITFTVALKVTDDKTELFETIDVTFAVEGKASAPVAKTTLEGFFENVISGTSETFEDFYDSLGKSVDAGSAFFVSGMMVKLDSNECVVNFDGGVSAAANANWKATIKDGGKVVGVFSYDSANDTLTFTPDVDYFVTLEKDLTQTLAVSFQITGDNDTAPVNAAKVTFDVIGVSEKPTISADDVTTTESNSESITVTVTDSYGETGKLTPDIVGVTFDVSQLSDAAKTEFAKLTNLTSFFKLENGTLTFDPNGKFDFLRDGDVLTFTVTLTATDNVTKLTATETVTFTVNGEKSAPLAGTTLTLVKNLSVTVGTLNGTAIGQNWQTQLGTSVDAGSSFKVSQMSLTIDGETYSVTPTYQANGNWSATFTDSSSGKTIGVFNYVAGNGNFKFTPDVNYFAYLAKDGDPETLTISFQIQGDNDTTPVDLTATATFNVKGISKLPELNVTNVSSNVTESSDDAAITFTFSDPNLLTNGTLTPSYSVADSGTLGMSQDKLNALFTLENGTLKFTPDRALDTLATTVTLNVTILVTDSVTKMTAEQVVAFTITPSAPILVVGKTGNITAEMETTDAPLTFDIFALWTHLNVTEDADRTDWTISYNSGKSEVYADLTEFGGSDKTLVGAFNIDTTDDYKKLVFTPDADLQTILRCGQTVTFSIDYTVADGRGIAPIAKTLTIEITGVHDGDILVKLETNSKSAWTFRTNDPTLGTAIVFTATPEYTISGKNVGAYYALGDVSATGTEITDWSGIILVDRETGEVTIKREAFAALGLDDNVGLIVNVMETCRGCGDEIGENLSLTFNISRFDSFTVIDGSESGDENADEIVVDLTTLLEDKVENRTGITWVTFTPKFDSITGDVGNGTDWETKLTGCFSIVNGVFTFTPSGNFDFLAVGEKAELTFTITVRDTQWNVAHDVIITITVKGEVSAPTAKTGIGVLGTVTYGDTQTWEWEKIATQLGATVDQNGKFVLHAISIDDGDNFVEFNASGVAEFGDVGTFTYTGDTLKFTPGTKYAVISAGGDFDTLSIQFQLRNEADTLKEKPSDAGNLDIKVKGLNAAPVGITGIVKEVFAGDSLTIIARNAGSNGGIANDINRNDNLSFVSVNEKPFKGSTFTLPGDLIVGLDDDGNVTIDTRLWRDKLDGDHILFGLTFVIEDGHGGSTELIVNIRIKGAPAAAPQSFGGDEMGTAMIMSLPQGDATPQSSSVTSDESFVDANIAGDQYRQYLDGATTDAIFRDGDIFAGDEQWFIAKPRTIGSSLQTYESDAVFAGEFDMLEAKL